MTGARRAPGPSAGGCVAGPGRARADALRAGNTDGCGGIEHLRSVAPIGRAEHSVRVGLIPRPARQRPVPRGHRMQWRLLRSRPRTGCSRPPWRCRPRAGSAAVTRRRSRPRSAASSHLIPPRWSARDRPRSPITGRSTAGPPPPPPPTAVLRRWPQAPGPGGRCAPRERLPLYDIVRTNRLKGRDEAREGHSRPPAREALPALLRLRGELLLLRGRYTGDDAGPRLEWPPAPFISSHPTGYRATSRTVG